MTWDRKKLPDTEPTRLPAAASSADYLGGIVLHANVSPERQEAIFTYGARVVPIAANYDESVAEAAQPAVAMSSDVQT